MLIQTVFSERSAKGQATDKPPALCNQIMFAFLLVRQVQQKLQNGVVGLNIPGEKGTDDKSVETHPWALPSAAVLQSGYPASPYLFYHRWLGR